MGNCIDNNRPQVTFQEDGAQPIPTQGQYGQNQHHNNQQNEDFNGNNQQNKYHDTGYRQYDNSNYQSARFQHSANNSNGNTKKKIDFDRLGSNFVFFEDAKKYFDDSPWYRDENDNSNRPSELTFANNQRQPQPNGLATKTQQINSNQSMYGISNMNHNQSMNRSIDKGYSQSVLFSNRKKQNIFYDASTYNQNPYVKTTHEQPPQRVQTNQQPYLNFSAISYH